MTHRGPFQPLLFCDILCVKPWGWKNLEKTDYLDSTFEKTDPTVYFLLLIFNLIIWYQGLASDGFFLLSNT